MPEASEAGPSMGSTPSHRAAGSRRRSSSTRSTRSTRPVHPRASSSQRSDTSNISSGTHQLSFTTGNCFDYVDPSISAFLHCPICLGPFLDPYASSVCSHTFCRQCIGTALSTQHQPDEDGEGAVAPRCPTCRTALELADFQPTALLIKNMVDTLRVRCPNTDKGCGYECERHLLRHHVAADCAFEYVDQNLTEGKRCGCLAKVMRKDWAAHGAVCPKRKVVCPTCDEVILAEEVEKHTGACLPQVVECEYCGLETTVGRLSRHVEQECGEAVVRCPHAGVGCAWSGPRRLLQRVEDTASKSSERTHLEDECRFEPLKAFFEVFAQQMTALSDENSALRGKLEDLQCRQVGQARRVDDCVHSLGSWYRSAGELRQERSGSQVGVDGEWDEFPLDAQNWERSLSQQSWAGRWGRAQSASAVDLGGWGRRRDGPQEEEEGWMSRESTDEARLAPPVAARSMPSTSGAYTPSPSRERASFLSDRRSANSLTSVSPHPFAPDTLDGTISSLTSSIAGLSTGLSSLDKRTEEGHIAAVKAGFDVGRVQEEVASLRHGLHAVRMQIHQILMTQQRHALFGGGGGASVGIGGEGGVGTSQVAGASGMPMLSPPLMRRWAGLEHTKL